MSSTIVSKVMEMAALLSPTNAIAILSAIGTLWLAVHFAVPQTSRGKRIRAKLLFRALFPRRIFRSRSGRLDIAAFLYSVFLISLTLGWALFSSDYFASATRSLLVDAFGVRSKTDWPGWLCSAVLTAAIYVAYEFAYWLNHWMSHRIPLLWEFHKVHHTAESLSPLTNYRVHPIDTIIFYNMAAAATGIAAGSVAFGFGRQTAMFAVGGSNLLVFVSAMLLTHLQHTHLYIAFTGKWGRILLSPAHHQIHHSVEARHHNRNFGATMAIWDHLFRTLTVPAAKREKMRFGVEGLGYDPHGARGALWMPLVEAWRHVARAIERRRPSSRSISELTLRPR